METTIILNTDGTGLWSRVARPVAVNYINLSMTKDSEDQSFFGELCVYFEESSWYVNNDGLIYTDKRFLKELHEFLKSQGFSDKAIDGVSYSEQGMQGDDYVSLDASDEFCKEWLAKFPETEIYEY